LQWKVIGRPPRAFCAPFPVGQIFGASADVFAPAVRGKILTSEKMGLDITNLKTGPIDGKLSVLKWRPE
jgi:hypothetical protein